MTQNPDIPTLVAPALSRDERRSSSTYASAGGVVSSVRVKRSEMPGLLIAVVRDDLKQIFGNEQDAALPLLLRQLENEYLKHWQMGTKAN